MSASSWIVCAGVFLVGSGSVGAGWPTDPGSPLVVGQINNGFDERAALRSGTDGSVWIAWQEAYCVGDVRLQHIDVIGELLAPEGIAFQPDPTCGLHLEPSMAVVGGDVIATRRLSSLIDTPIQRYSPEGASLWSSPFVSTESRVVELIEPIGGSDALVIGYEWDTIYIDRLDPSGNEVWGSTLSFYNHRSANFDITGYVPDDAGGGYVFWESPATYVRHMLVTRINGDGTLAWSEPVSLVDVLPPDRGASRHTHARMAPDGAGGAIVVYTEGFEQPTSPAGLLMQRINPDGSLGFPKPGVRVSTRFTRQFGVDLEHDPLTHDLFVVWRDGLLDQQRVFAQRMRVNGARLWGDEGVEVSALDPTTGSYDGVWVGSELKSVVGAPDSVSMIRVSADGVVNPEPVLVSEGSVSSFVKATRSLDGLVVAWQRDNEGLDDVILAQRVNRNNELGGVPVCAPDLNGDGGLDFFDISLLLQTSVDYTGDASFDFFDISAFLADLSAGCP